ncbi:hypothetical protein GGS26DRAFT_598845 [Hypomontagnella submonticulosa]|nr:hypothetical protein GGS26DRAFT_598845 [Hypomontagnella submonticulosa]
MASSGSSTTNSFHKRFQGGGSCFSDTIQTSLSSHPRLGSRSKFITCLVTCSESAPYVFTLFHSVQNTDTNSVGIGSQLQLALSSFYANSLGGLVAKQALVTAKLEGEYNPVYLSTKGLVFFGTLHWGSKIAEIGGTVAKIVRLVRREARNNFIDVLKENSLFTAESRDNSALSKTRTNWDFIVTSESPTLGASDEQEFTGQTDHSGFCIYDDPESDAFEQLIFDLQRVANRPATRTNLETGALVLTAGPGALKQWNRLGDMREHYPSYIPESERQNIYNDLYVAYYREIFFRARYSVERHLLSREGASKDWNIVFENGRRTQQQLPGFEFYAKRHITHRKTRAAKEPREYLVSSKMSRLRVPYSSSKRISRSTEIISICTHTTPDSNQHIPRKTPFIDSYDFISADVAHGQPTDGVYSYSYLYNTAKAQNREALTDR